MQMFSAKTREWFLSSVGTPTEAQRMGWQAISEGRDALISSPTGSGKTLAAFLYFLDEMRRELDAGALSEGLRVVYVSPLKALGNDIRQNLERPLAGLGLSGAVRVAVRTGDTDARTRREMIKHPPHILITTPESLYLLLTSLSGRDMLKTARTVIVDELHAVLSSKRGTHLFLSLARLDALCGGRVRRVGLSATVNPPEEAARHLTGGGPCAVIVPKAEKRTELTVDVPVPDMRQLPEHSVWPAIADRIIEALDHARTVLVFVDGRAGCERLALKINERAGQTLARTHHGCVSKEQRLEAERMLKSGELRVMVATSSMELGIDVGEIDLVVQVGPPPGVSALLQRLGRAGHNPGRVSRMRVYPRTAAEAIGCALVCEAAREGRIERVRAPEMCLDVLSQHLVSMAAAGAYTVDEAVRVLSRAYAYRSLASEDVKAVLGMLSGDYERMDDRPVKPRVVYDRLSGRVSGDAYTRMLALSAGGTIPDRGWFAVTLADGTRLGELDEEFVFEARLGDKFYLGAFPWKIEEITRDRVIVSPTSPEGATSPFWKGDRAARAYETGAFYGSLLAKWEDAARRSPAALRAALCAAGLTPDAAENAARVLESQLRAVGCLATDRVLVAEHFSDEAGEHQLMLHSPFGDAVNRALGMLLARRAAAATGADARAYDDDDGALICLVGGQPIPDALLPTLAATSAPDTYTPSPSPNPVSAPANPNTASDARFTSTNPDTAPSVSYASTNPNTAPDARFTSINPGTAPGVSCASVNPNATSGAHFTSINPDTVSGERPASVGSYNASDERFPLCGAAAEVRAMLPASPMFSMAFRYNVQRALLNGVRGGRRQPLWVQRLRGAEALGAAAAHPEHPMMRETLNECANGYLDLSALTRLLSAIRAGQVRVYEVHTDAPSPLCLNLRRQVEAEMMYDTAIPSAAVNLSKEALLTLSPTEEAVKSASRPARAPRSADELHARLLSEGDLLAEEADAPAEWMDALELAGRAVYIEPGLWIARENEDEYRLALEENDAAALSRVVRRAARFHGAQTAETFSERYAVDEARAQDALTTLLSEGILREFGGAYVHAELYENAQRMTVALNRQRVETQPARAFARMLSQRVRGVGSSAAQLAQALDSLRGCAYPAAAWEGYLLPARVANYRPQLLDEALARGEAAYRVLPAERTQLPSETTHRVLPAERSQLSNEARTQAAARPHDAAPSCARVSIDGSQLPGEAVDRNEVDDRVLPAERPQSGRTTDSRSIPTPEIDGVPADSPAASRVRGSAASTFELHAQRRGTAVLDQSGSTHPKNGSRDGRTSPGERTRASRAASSERVCFDSPDDEGEYEPLPNDLTDMEREILQTLTARGASFASRLPVNAGDALKSLLARGLVRADSFLPVREMLAAESGSVKKVVRRRVRVMDAGRWSRVGALPRTSAEALVERLFDRFGIVCRETAGADWNAAFGVLKHMEYAGKARRGYFVKGLSGAQFVRETDYSAITAQLRQSSSESFRLPADSAQAQNAYLSRENNLVSPHGSNDDADLSRTQDAHLPRKDNLASSHGSTHDAAHAQLRQPSAECVWLPAADPMQAWGAYLAHEEDRAFLRVPGAAVALMDGAVVAVAEKQGETLRVFDEAAAPEALRALADAFRRGTIFPTLPRLLIKKYPPTAAPHLESAGFTREMLDYTLMRRG